MGEYQLDRELEAHLQQHLECPETRKRLSRAYEDAERLREGFGMARVVLPSMLSEPTTI